MDINKIQQHINNIAAMPVPHRAPQEEDQETPTKRIRNPAKRKVKNLPYVNEMRKQDGQ